MHRTAVIGTAEQYPTEELAQTAVNGLRMQINKRRNREREQSILVADLIDHYLDTKLFAKADWRSHVNASGCCEDRELLRLPPLCLPFDITT